MNEIDKFLKKEINEFKYISNNENDTLNLAKEFAKAFNGNEIISLNGELGTGKTVFMKGVANYFGILKDVSSPTFTIVNEYNLDKFNIYHFDVYRIKDSYEFENTIGTDYFYSGICIIEWGDIIDDILPENTVHIDISKIDENKREFCIRRKN